MINKFSIKFGDFLFKHAFPIYNTLYTIFKSRSDRSEIDLIKRTVKPGNVVLDIGGNIGFYTKILSNLVGPNGLVYTFEPDAINFQRLKQNTITLKNVQLINKAVSYHNAGVILYKSNTLNVDHRTYAHDDTDFHEDIESISIDELFKNQSIDFIKMDIQGYEMQALRGMINTLRKNMPVFIMEYWPHGLKSAGESPIEMVAFLESLGYEIKEIIGGIPTEISFNIESSIGWGSDKFTNIFASKKRD